MMMLRVNVSSILTYDLARTNEEHHTSHCSTYLQETRGNEPTFKTISLILWHLL